MNHVNLKRVAAAIVGAVTLSAGIASSSFAHARGLGGSPNGGRGGDNGCNTCTHSSGQSGQGTQGGVGGSID